MTRTRTQWSGTLGHLRLRFTTLVCFILPGELVAIVGVGGRVKRESVIKAHELRDVSLRLHDFLLPLIANFEVLHASLDFLLHAGIGGQDEVLVTKRARALFSQASVRPAITWRRQELINYVPPLRMLLVRRTTPSARTPQR